MPLYPSNTVVLMNNTSIFYTKNRQQPLSNLSRSCARIRQICSSLVIKPGVHSSISLKTGGFQYTGNSDTARCEECGLEVSNWTLDMKPWTIHSARSPYCPFVRRLIAEAFSGEFSSLSRPTIVERNTAGQENPSKRRKTEIIMLESPLNTSIEADLFQEARRRTFSDWPRYFIPSAEDMCEGGFFACNVGDRVICIYCNIVFHQWTPHADDPSKTHKVISPHCPYVKEKLLNGEQPHIINNIQNSTSAANNHLSTRNNTDSLQFSNLLRPPEKNGKNSRASRPSTVSLTMPIAEMIRQDSFYPRIQHDEACSECQKSLQSIDPCDNEMADCARWLIHCRHSRRITADQIYDQIQKFKQAQQSCAEGNTGSDDMFNTNPTRSDVRIPQQLLDQNVSLSILQRIWRNELLLNYDDSISDVRLLLACILFQKQIDCIDGKNENILTPGEKLAEIIKEEKENFVRRQATARLAVHTAAQERSDGISNSSDAEMMQSNDPTSSNPCMVCLVEEKRLACLPCRHLTACVSCGKSLKSCPLCRQEITAFIRVFV